MNKENASKLWKIIQEAGDYLDGQLPDHPNHPKGRNAYAANKVHWVNWANDDDLDLLVFRAEVQASMVKQLRYIHIYYNF